MSSNINNHGQESRLARINQIKEKMMNKKDSEENKYKSMPLDFQIDFNQVI